MRAEWANIDIDGTPMETYVTLPDGDGPFPAVVVSMHAYGVDRGVQAFCDGLASEGFAAVAGSAAGGAARSGMVVPPRTRVKV